MRKGASQKEVGEASTSLHPEEERQYEALQCQVDQIETGCCTGKTKGVERHWKRAFLILLCIIVVVLVIVVAVLVVSPRSRYSRLSDESPQMKSRSPTSRNESQLLALTQGKNGNTFLNFGVRLDSRLQECQDAHWKQSFPDLDYALLGYDILNGYPLENGHDPGFTHPIFLSDYTSGKKTADCRYSVPKGLIVVPDVSCQTSFSSQMVRNRVEMSESLGIAANVEGGGFGFKFSASASYKKSVAQMSSGEYLYIISKAQCRYYFSKLDLTEPPPFHPGFVSWAKRLSSSDADQNDIIQFIKYFGTHYVSDVTFGARFMKNHKVSQTKYEELSEEKFSVAVQASYSGSFSIGGGFSMDEEERKAVSKFQKSVETSTITVGAAPPSNGDAMTWASSVQENPVPITYSLSAIHNLFTERYTEHLPGVNLKVVREKLINASKNYCEAMKQEGRTDSCDESLHLGVSLLDISVKDMRGYRYLPGVDETYCRAICLLEEKCVALQYISVWEKCMLLDTRFTAVNPPTVKPPAIPPKSKIVVFLTRLQREHKNFILDQLKVDPKQPRRSLKRASTVAACSSYCAQDLFCQAFVFCSTRKVSWCGYARGNCLLYSKEQITAVETDPHSELHFVWKNYTHD